MIVGAGGLGSPAALYWPAGVGRLSIADDDHVELSNLQRQIAHTQASLGESKARSACAAARALNPDCQAQPLSTRLSGEALLAAVTEADLVLDCTDRFSSRFAINRACVTSRTPLISGAAIRFSGQLAVFDHADDSPCYACLYGEQGDDEALSCAESGVIAPLVGVIGSFQALEALKWLSARRPSAPRALHLRCAQRRVAPLRAAAGPGLSGVRAALRVPPQRLGRVSAPSQRSTSALSAGR